MPKIDLFALTQDPPPYNGSRCYEASGSLEDLRGLCQAPVNLQHNITFLRNDSLVLDTIESVRNVVQIRPQAVNLRLRPGRAANLSIAAGHAKDYPGNAKVTARA